MQPRISRDEFAVLTYLHQNAEAYDESSAFEVDEIAKVTGLDPKDVKKSASYLSSVGMARLTRPTDVTYGNMNDFVVFLTGNGENFMRELEDRLLTTLQRAPDVKPGSLAKITTKVGGFVYDTGKDIIAKALAEWMKDHIG